MRIAMILAPALLLAACDGQGPNAADGGTQVSIKGDSGNFAAGIDKDGRVAIDVPGLKGSIALPKIDIDAGNVDIGGVGLPEGSKIDTVNVTGDGPDERVRLAFTSPLGATGVRDWFQGKLSAEGFKLNAQGDDLTGTTAEGKPFRLTTKAAGEGRTQSVIAIGE